ncbi:MAG TPA: TauD/TfdA family dioxygenase [Streptosporangiaceae bacterium]|jgi:taurine dioxygenase|nr:TauD/TfdA family dioxygenase [Streptosporangiaceae bacterium]
MTDTISTRTRIGVRRLAGHIGAEITSADAGTELGDDTIAQVRQALLDHKVVFLRDQSLDYARQVAFAERLGPLTLGHPTLASPPDQPFLEEIDSRKGTRANHWHTDVTFVDRPPAFTLLHAVVIPPVGGDTLWANTVAAYESLPLELRDLADRLRIVHTNAYDYAATAEREERDDAARQAQREEFVSTVYETEHPAVRVHPETGERSLILGGFARTVVGFSPQASRDLIRVLQDYVTRPEHTVRWQWRVGDLAIWDNRATQHYAIFDYGGEHRRGERVTVAGPAPVGIDGRSSVALKGEATTYYASAA